MGRFVHIHFLNLLDGSPCPAPPSNIAWELPQDVNGVAVEGLSIISSRIMMRVYCWDVALQGAGRRRKILVWDWKTRDLVRLQWLE